MSTASEANTQNLLECVRVEDTAPWFIYRVPILKFPLEPAKRLQLLTAMRSFVDAIRRAKSWQRSVWLLLDELQHEDAVTEISRNAAVWQPEMGIGLRPEEPSPHYWTSKDLLDREYSATMPTLKHTVVHLETDEAGAELACQSMTGRGSLIQALHSVPAATLLSDWHKVLQPTVEEEGLAAYPLYVPLLGLASVRSQRGRLEAWMGHADVYLRESAEDSAVVIVSRVPLESFVKASEYLWMRDPAVHALAVPA